MPVIIDDPPEAHRRNRIRHGLYVVLLLIGALSVFLTSAPWLALLLVAGSGLAAYFLQHLDSFEPWWPPNRLRKALTGFRR